MAKKCLSILLIISLFSTTCFGDDSALRADLNKKSYNDDFAQRFGFTALCAFLGAAGGAAIWYARTMKELDNIDKDYKDYMDLNFDDLESAEEWLENKKKETEESAKKDLGTWVLGGALIGSILGIVLYPESDSYGLINFSTKGKPEIRIPLPNYNLRNKRITIPIIEYNFK